MKRNYPTIPFERYADDIIVHCSSEKQAKWIKMLIKERLLQCKLELHPEKTKIVYCKDDNRRGNYSNETFVFLGYLFAPRKAQSQNEQRFVGFGPAVSSKAAQEMRHEMKSWRFHKRSDKSLEDLSRLSNSIFRGWINYYGQYYKSALYRVFNVLNRILIRWAMRKYKRFKFHQRQAAHWLRRVARQQPWLFAHWEKGFRP